MGSTKLVIRKEQENSEGLCVIYVLYTHKSENCYFSTGEKVPINSWDTRKCKVRNSFRGHSKLNDLLIQIKSHIDGIRIDLRINKIEPTVDAVRNKVKENREPEKPKLKFFQIFDQYLNHKKNNQKILASSMRQYQSFGEHLKNFEKFRNKRITLSSIDNAFYYEFMDYLELTLEMKVNTAGNQIKNLKSFLNWCSLNGYEREIKADFRNFKKPKNSATIIALSETELQKFWSHKFDNITLERVRDVFCLSCSTGLRYSDCKRITRDNILTESLQNEEKNDFIIMHTQKTKEEVKIPLTNYSRTVLEKYEYNVKVYSNQKMNDYLKVAAKQAELDGIREILEFKARTKNVIKKPLHEVISSHAGRRTFVTISLEKGMSVNQVMAITGHKTLTSFQRYMAYSKSEMSRIMKNSWD